MAATLAESKMLKGGNSSRRCSKARWRFAFSVMVAMGGDELEKEMAEDESRPSQTRMWWYGWTRAAST